MKRTPFVCLVYDTCYNTFERGSTQLWMAAIGVVANLIAQGAISERSAVIASYALCGFANFGSIAVLLGGVGGMAPSRRGELAELGLRSILAGTLATLMTGCVVGTLI